MRRRRPRARAAGRSGGPSRASSPTSAAFWRELVGDSQLRWIGPEKGVIHLATAAVVNAVWDLVREAGREAASGSSSSEMAPERDRVAGRLPLPDRCADAGRGAGRSSSARPGPRGTRPRPAAPRRLPGLHDVGGLARLRRRQGAAALPRGAGGRLDAVQDEGRRATSTTTSGGCASSATRSAPSGCSRSTRTSAGTSASRSTGCGRSPRSTRTGSRSRRAPTTSSGTRRSPGPSRRSASRPASTSTTGSCSSSCSRPGPSASARSMPAGWAASTRSSAILLLAAKFGVTVCPHAGGVGLCELVQHLSPFDYIAVSGRLDGRMIEYVDHLHEHFVDPVVRPRWALPPADGTRVQRPRCGRRRSSGIATRTGRSGGRPEARRQPPAVAVSRRPSPAAAPACRPRRPACRAPGGGGCRCR